MANRQALYLAWSLGWVAWMTGVCGAETVVITEFMAANNIVFADEEGEYPDWIEIQNQGSSAVDLAGWFLTDDAGDLGKWAFPGIALAPNGFVVVFASGKNRAVPGSPLHSNFSLDAEGEYLALVRPDGVTVVSEYQFPNQRDHVSYGLGQAVGATRLVRTNSLIKWLVPANDSLGLSWTGIGFNQVSWPTGTNGVGYDSSVPGFAVRMIRANVAVTTLAVAESVLVTPAQQIGVSVENRGVVNYLNTGDAAHYGADNAFPGTSIGGDVEDFVMEATATVTIPTAGDWTFGVNSDDGFRLSVGGFGVQCDCLRGPSDTLGTITFPAAGDYPLRLVFWERGGGSGVELFAAQGAFAGWNSTNFRLVGDTGGGGLAVRSTPVGATGYAPLIRTDVSAALFGRNSSVYIRIPFPLGSLAVFNSLTLQMKYDDGFVAWLNGVEVARANAPAIVPWNGAATVNRPDALAFAYETFDLTPYANLLVVGNNVLAFQGLNQNATSSDFLLLAELGQYVVTNLAEHYFAVPTPGTFNSTNYADRVSDTRFSHDRGFYDTNILVTLMTATPGATIRYTRNGSEPTASTGFLYAGPIPITNTTTLRTAAFKTGLQPSDVDTHTYVFVRDVVRQADGVAPAPDWPAPRPPGAGQTYDYGMDATIANDAIWGPLLTNALKSIPTFSIVTSVSNLFDPASGIYANPNGDGLAWERPASVELIYPDGREGFHANCGLRVRGGFSRSPDNPKHAFRFLFREVYGLGRLEYPVFGPGAAQEFDGFDLRCAQNYSWSFGGDPGGNFLRDQSSRDAQLALNGTGERGDFYHLYVNGQYWGLYNSDERPEAFYGESYFGGQKDQYDVIKVEAGPYTIGPTDGDMDAWTGLWQAAVNGFASDAAYQQAQGNNPDGTRNPGYAVLLDVPNLIDYMLVILYGGNLDAPISAFLGNTAPNNWYGLRERSGQFGGFRFIAHDSEHTMLNVNEDRTGPYPAGDPVTGGGVSRSNPQYVWQQLQANAEFRVAVADHVQRHFFNGGALTPQAVLSRFLARSNEIQLAVVAESARWGDAKREPPLTRNDWINAVNNVAQNFIPNRSAVVLNQLRADGLFPSLTAPVLNPFGGSVPFGFTLVLTHSNPSGTIYYTLNGADPRRSGGAIDPGAAAYSAPLVMHYSTHVRVRVRDGANWSPLVEATFYVEQDYSGLALTEIHYHPASEGAPSGDDTEFLELKNVGNNTLDLSGAGFEGGLNFAFTNGSLLAPGQFLVLARDLAAFEGRYPGVAVQGIYTGRLDNGGETLRLTNNQAATIFAVTYDDDVPWPVTPDGHGFSLVPRFATGPFNTDAAANWRASTARGGSPGADDSASGIPPVVIQEALTHTDLPDVDAIELVNTTADQVTIGGWFLSDEAASPMKFRIPSGQMLEPYGIAVFDEQDFNPTPGFGTSFSLSSEGDQVYLFSGDASTNLTGYSHGFAFGAAANGVSFGRYLNSVGEEHFPAQFTVTLNQSNAGPRVGPVVLHEIHYHPVDGQDEFIEVYNTTGDTVALYDPEHPSNTWRLNGLAYTFPGNVSLPPFGFALLVGVNPPDFRAKYSVPASVPILGPYLGQLQDSGERLRLERPDTPNTNGVAPYITVDEVRYNDKWPWPVSADGAGPSLQRLEAGAYANDPINWFASGMTPGQSNTFNAAPGTAITSPTDGATFIPPSNILIAAAAWDTDGAVRKVEFFAGPLKLGERVASPYAFTWTNAPPGTHSLTVRVTDDDFAVTISPSVTAIVFTPIPTTLVSRGSTWRYLDTGANLGGTWTARLFNDSTWPSGAAQLGYGDGDETTPLGFGPDGNNKYITTYFRRSFEVTNAHRFLSLFVNVLRDDGAVVFLNGSEVYRSNMPPGPVGAGTLATGAVGGADETSMFYGAAIPSLGLINGTNVLAVEIHQAAANSSDISFDLELTGTLGPIQPSISLVAPAHNSIFTVPGNVFLQAAANDIDGVIVRVEFYQNETRLGTDTESPFAFQWLGAGMGDYLLTAVAYNNGGLARTSAPVAVRLVANDPPTAQITSPAPLARFNRPAQVVVEATALDSNGPVDSVTFSVNGTFLSEDFAAPYQAIWVSPPTGLHTLRAMARDPQSATGESEPIQVWITAYASTNVTLVPTGAVWRYLDTGVAPDPTWTLPGYEDQGWGSGPAELGYGDGPESRPEATVIQYGLDINAKFSTYYFRRVFMPPVVGPLDSALTLRLMRDDGGVVYLNGQEVLRSNLPEGPIQYDTYALAAVGGVDEFTYVSANVDAGLVGAGPNVVAAEIHQSGPGSSDVSFDLELTGTALLLPTPPLLEIRYGDGWVVVRWPASASDFRLYACDQAVSMAPWYPAIGTPANDGTWMILTLPIETAPRFFQLRNP